jgi:hypothetical protein
MLAAAPGLLAASSVRASEPWATLRRPLHIPHLSAGSKCPVSQVDSRVPWKRINIFGVSGIGQGPVYPGLGGHSGLLFATRDEQYGGPWFGEKVFWYVQPSYRGPVLIRGRRLDGPQLVRFNGKRLPPSELHIESAETVSWQGQPRGSRGVPSGVRIIAPGCYGFQIDGTSFSRIVIFVADLAR